LRGGSWNNNPDNARADNRSLDEAGHRAVSLADRGRLGILEAGSGRSSKMPGGIQD
jgi:hypothetical protein